jgi:hypothetical protein
MLLAFETLNIDLMETQSLVLRIFLCSYFKYKMCRFTPLPSGLKRLAAILIRTRHEETSLASSECNCFYYH